MPHIITSTQDIWEWDNMGYRTNNLWLAESPDGRDIPFFGGDDGMEIWYVSYNLTGSMQRDRIW